MMRNLSFSSMREYSFFDHTGMLGADRLRELSARLQQAQMQSSNYWQTDFGRQESKALSLYFGMMRGDEVEGMSTQRSREVATVVDRVAEAAERAIFSQGAIIDIAPNWDTPAMRRLDRGGVRLNCQAMSRRVEAIIRNTPESRKVFGQFMLAGLLGKVGFLRVDGYKPPPSSVTMLGKSTQQVIRILTLHPDFKLLEKAVDIVEPSEEYPDGMKWHLAGKVNIESNSLIQAIPNWFMMWDPQAISFDQRLPNGAGYIGMIDLLPWSEIARRYPQAPEKFGDGDPQSGEDIYHLWGDSRFQTVLNQAGGAWSSGIFGDDGAFDSQRMLPLLDEYVKFDLDGDGVEEIVCVRRVSNHILYVSPVKDNPFAWWSPKPNQGHAVGQSAVEKVSDLQEMSTDLIRNTMNLVGLSSTPRVGVNMSSQTFMSEVSGADTLKDLQEAAVGGIVRTPGIPSEHVFPFQPIDPRTIEVTLAARNAVSQEVSDRTGISRAVYGGEMEGASRSATGMHLGQMASALPTKAIIESFGQGVSILARKIMDCEARHGRAVVVDMNGEKIEIDPRVWNFDVICTANLSGAVINPEQSMAHLQVLADYAMKAIETLGPDNPFFNLRHASNIIREMVSAMGFKDTNRFVGDPTDDEFAALAERLAEMGQDGGAEAKMREVELDHEAALLKIESDRETALLKAQLDVQVAMYKAALEASQKDAQMRIEATLEQLRLALEQKMEQKKIEANERVGKAKAKASSIGRPVAVGGKKTG